MPSQCRALTVAATTSTVGLVALARTTIYVIQDEKFAYVNSRFVEFLGYTPDEPLAVMHTNNYIECIDCILMR